MHKQGWRQKSSNRGAGASHKGAEMAEKCIFRASFCQISSDRKLNFPPTGELDASNRGSSPPLASPLCTKSIRSVQCAKVRKYALQVCKS